MPGKLGSCLKLLSEEKNKDPNEEDLKMEDELISEIATLRSNEEKYWHQRVE